MEREYIGAPGQSQEAVPLGALVAVSLRRVAGLGKEEDYRHPLDGGGKMNPRLFLIGIAALLLATGTAHAATPEFPKTEVLGTWCLIGQAPLSNNTASPYPYMYHRGPCKGEEWVEIKQTGYDGPGLSCKIVESNPNFSPLAG